MSHFIHIPIQDQMLEVPVSDFLLYYYTEVNAKHLIFVICAAKHAKNQSFANGPSSKDTIASLLASLMEVVRTTVACECVYVRAMVIKALIWMQNPYESFDELESIIACELPDPSWPSALLNDILLTLHARFKVFLICLFYFAMISFSNLSIYECTIDLGFRGREFLIPHIMILDP